MCLPFFILKIKDASTEFAKVFSGPFAYALFG